MGTLYESIISLCNERGISGSKMCVDLGLSKSLGTKLKENSDKTITAETAQKIADYFGVSVDRVLGKEEKPTSQNGESDYLDNIYESYIKLCNSVNKTPSAVALEMGLSKTAVNGWKTGRSKPTDATLQKIADYFNVPVDRVLGKHEVSSVDILQASLTPSDLAAWRVIRDMADRILGTEQQKRPTPQKGEPGYDDMVLLEAFNRADEATKAAIRLLLKVQ